jgi:hypothetical protein
LKVSSDSTDQADSEDEKYTKVGCSSSIGLDQLRWVSIRYGSDPLIRVVPALTLRDLDEALFMPILNRSLAQKVKGIHAASNGYKLLEIPFGSFYVDEDPRSPEIPAQFSSQELSDPWVRLRPKKASAFRFRFDEETPRRLYESRRVQE